MPSTELSNPITRIAIVDCDDRMRSALRKLFEEHGALVDDYASAEACTRALRGRSDPVDMLLCRFELEGNRGIALLEQLDGSTRSLPTVMYSTRGDVPDAVCSCRAGAKDFIDHAKPDLCFRNRVLSLLIPSPESASRPPPRRHTWPRSRLNDS